MILSLFTSWDSQYLSRYDSYGDSFEGSFGVFVREILLSLSCGLFLRFSRILVDWRLLSVVLLIRPFIAADSGRNPATDSGSSGSSKFVFVVPRVDSDLQRLQGSRSLHFRQPEGFTFSYLDQIIKLLPWPYPSYGGLDSFIYQPIKSLDSKSSLGRIKIHLKGSNRI